MPDYRNYQPQRESRYDRPRKMEVRKSAAPNPALPNSKDVKESMSKCVDELRAQQMEYTSLMRNRARLDSDEPVANSSFGDDLGLVEFRGLLVSHPVITEVVERNKQIVKRAQNKGFIKGINQSNDATYLRNVSKTMEQVDEILPSVYTSVFWRSKIVREKAMSLAQQYNEISSIWQDNRAEIDCFNIRYHRYDIDNAWGSDQPHGPTRNCGRTSSKLFAVDVPMYLDPREKAALCFHDDNKLVEDPIREHNAFKRRTGWTKEERAIFTEKWNLHPKKFRQILCFLPNKTMKDVIEFYYLYKNTDNLAKKKKRVHTK